MDLLLRLEACYDAIPRDRARVEEYGVLRLFVREGVGWPFYARPGAPDVQVGADDVRAVVARQEELGQPAAVEWIHDLVPTLADAAREAGLTVSLVPLLVLDGDPAPPPPGVQVELIDPQRATAQDLALADAVADVGFSVGGVDVGPAGPPERDARAATADPQRLAAALAELRSGSGVGSRVVAALPDVPELPGPLAVGALQGALGAAEVVGVATLPAARRRGLGAAVAGLLARHARALGYPTVFLSAQNDAVARVYERAGFRRVGTAGLAEAAPAHL